MKTISVAAAAIIKEGKVFCARRPNRGETALKWEFPGGKLEVGETAKEAIVREILEELQSKIKVETFVSSVEYQYETFFLKMDLFACSLVEGPLVLNEHVESCWKTPQDLDTLDWAPADKQLLSDLVKFMKILKK